jgi:hypothetical protein
LPDRDVGDAGTGLLDDARRLVPEQHRHRPDATPIDDRQVGVAQPGGLDADQQFVVAGWGQLELGDREGPRFGVAPGQADVVEDGAADLHASSLPDALGAPKHRSLSLSARVNDRERCFGESAA